MRNMKDWAAELIAAPVKKPLPLLSFPCTQLMGVTVQQLVKDAALQAQGMKLVADRIPSAAAVSLMDLSVESEAFGASVRFSEGEVPTVVGALICDEDDADAAIVNTCCFIMDAQKESIDQILALAQKRTEGALKALIVTGCMAQRYKEEVLKEIPEVDAVIGTTSEGRIAEILDEILRTLARKGKGLYRGYKKGL